MCDGGGRILTGKEKVNLSLFTGDMILYIENPKELTEKLLELITSSSRLQDIRSIKKIYYITLYLQRTSTNTCYNMNKP